MKTGRLLRRLMFAFPLAFLACSKSPEGNAKMPSRESQFEQILASPRHERIVFRDFFIRNPVPEKVEEWAIVEGGKIFPFFKSDNISAISFEFEIEVPREIQNILDARRPSEGEMAAARKSYAAKYKELDDRGVEAISADPDVIAARRKSQKEVAEISGNSEMGYYEKQYWIMLSEKRVKEMEAKAGRRINYLNKREQRKGGRNQAQTN